MGRRMDGKTDGWVDREMKWMDGWTVGWKDEWVGGWMDRRMDDGWVDE